MSSVLIVEDHEDFRKLIRETLEGGDFELLEAADGDTALELARERLPALIFLDWRMPGKSGIEVCRELKDDRRTAGIRIVMLTGKERQAARRAAHEAGADDYIVKPFSQVQLLSKVRDALGPEALGE